ncbi:MAG: hypothetical protein JRF07_05795 [Deltaproteobacteria bacterium]|jgi:tetratricopeptide (TPR) repeat protein|nr:hypothetical protein [Deltaproteobacteria bacterium]
MATAADLAGSKPPTDLAGTTAPDALQDLYFGETLFYAFKGDWFDAIARLDTELGQFHRLDQPELDSLFAYLDEAEFAVGDFELAYRMHQRAGRAIKQVINGEVPSSVRNGALYRLARIYFQKDQPVNALHALQQIDGEVPEAIQDDLAFLQAQVALATGRNTDAVQILQGLQEVESLNGFASYNLGIALIRDGREREGREFLDRTGLLADTTPASLAIKDKANLVLGYKLLEQDQPDAAQQVLERVRLTGVFSNRALLGWGWADAAQGRFARSLVPWSLLVERDVTDVAVQEAMLALPFAYGKLNRYGQAALLYGEALQTFSSEADRLTASINSIRKGAFLKALTRDELLHDADWLVRLRQLPDAPESYYLLQLMASHDFQESLKNYVDLEALRKRLVSWQRDLDAFEQLVAQRQAYYQPLLPEIDQAFRELDSQMRLRLEQRELITKRLKAILTAPRPVFLATAQERLIRQQLDRLEQALIDRKGPVPRSVSARIQRLRGVLTWNIQTDYDRRLTEAYHNLHALDTVVERLERQYVKFVHTRQEAAQSYQGYTDKIRRQRQQVVAAQAQVQKLLARQGHVLEVMAINELSQRRDRLDGFVVKTRFALADSYDRAARAKSQERVEP